MFTIPSLRTTTLTVLSLFASQLAFAQAPMSQAKENISYTFQSGDGTNASALVWLPGKGVYATAIAGNSQFPLETFSATGSPSQQGMVGEDIRGMWYDAKKGMLMANGAGETGWLSMDPAAIGGNEGWQLVKGGQNQPDFQSALTQSGKMVYGYLDGNIYAYTSKGKQKAMMPISGYSATENLNTTTICATGNSGYPLALFDYADGKVVFFDTKANCVGSSKLPESAVRPDMFRFAFANNMAWIYDVDNRTWTAYRVFQ